MRCMALFIKLAKDNRIQRTLKSKLSRHTTNLLNSMNCSSCSYSQTVWCDYGYSYSWISPALTLVNACVSSSSTETRSLQQVAMETKCKTLPVWLNDQLTGQAIDTCWAGQVWKQLTRFALVLATFYTHFIVLANFRRDLCFYSLYWCRQGWRAIS